MNNALRLVLFKNIQYILVAFPVMNDYGQIKFVCEFNLLFKNLNLFFSRGRVVVVIKTYFAYGDNLFVRGE